MKQSMLGTILGGAAFLALLANS